MEDQYEAEGQRIISTKIVTSHIQMKIPGNKEVKH